MDTTLVDYGRVLHARWRWIVWGVLLALAATTLFLILRPPLYRSEATIFVRTPGDVSRVLDGGDSYAQARARTYAALAGSTSVSSRVIADLGLDLRPETLSDRIEATNPPGTALIHIAVSAPSAAEAQRTATVLLSEYAATVRALESVPGSLVPRADLVVVDPPGRAVRVMAWGASVPVVLLGAALIGMVLGATVAVLHSIFDIFDSSALDRRDATRVTGAEVLGSTDTGAPIDAAPDGSGAAQGIRRAWTALKRSGKATG
jgi:capsular polysaccharide biosynthesis protein